MADIKTFKSRRDMQHDAMTNFAKYLVEQGWECNDFEPANFCVLASGNSAVGGAVEYVFADGGDRESLLKFIGMIEAAKATALEELKELDDLEV